ncbi:MAG: hypothetical protein HY704_06340 [Gemmatimonadetes bacterium]|nr:hypothetical protein [Gemmatimonadota bacterium]
MKPAHVRARMPTFVPALPLAALLLAACEPGARQDGGAAAEFYSGKVLEIIVPFGPGGGTDTWTRVLVPHLQKRLGNGAAVQVINVAGASSVAGANEFAVRRRHDGLSALVSAGSTFLGYLLGEPMVRYDFREFAPIIGSPTGGVAFVAPKLGIRRAAELGTVREPLVYGGISAAGNDLMLLLAFELLDLKVQTILGYASRGATRLAFEQGETNIEYQTMPAYVANVMPLVKAGAAVPLFSFGLVDETGEVVRDPAVPDVPSVREVYVERFGHEPSGVEWEAYKAVLAAAVTTAKVLWLHADAPPAGVAALREAARDLAQDSAFREAARVEVGDYPFFVGDDITRAIAAATQISPATLQWVQNLLREKYGVERLEASR